MLSLHPLRPLLSSRTASLVSRSAPKRLISTRIKSLPPAIPFRTHPSTTPATPTTHTFFHAPTSTWTYVVFDQAHHAVIIDPVLDYDSSTRTASTSTADALLSFVHANRYTVTRILETHAHADHLTSAQYLKRQLMDGQETGEVPVCIGERIRTVQDRFGERFGVSEEEKTDAFDQLWRDGETFRMGELEWEVMPLPGHTPDSVGYKCGEAVFVGDSIFLPDVGSARTDFPGGSSTSLFRSTSLLLSLPPTTRIFSGHDYPLSRLQSCSALVGEHKERNKHLKDGVTEEEFRKMRDERDGGLGEPRLLEEALQVNIRGGRFARDRMGERGVWRRVKEGEGEGIEGV